MTDKTNTDFKYYAKVYLKDGKHIYTTSMKNSIDELEKSLKGVYDDCSLKDLAGMTYDVYVLHAQQTTTTPLSLTKLIKGL